MKQQQQADEKSLLNSIFLIDCRLRMNKLIYNWNQTEAFKKFSVYCQNYGQVLVGRRNAIYHILQQLECQHKHPKNGIYKLFANNSQKVTDTSALSSTVTNAKKAFKEFSVVNFILNCLYPSADMEHRRKSDKYLQEQFSARCNVGQIRNFPQRLNGEGWME